MKTEFEIEKELTSLKEASLSAQDKSAIKATLLEHATKTLAPKSLPIVSPYTSWLHYSYASFAALFLVFVGVTYASQDSLPGEPLYALKVNVFEETISLSKIDPIDRTSYEISRMESRLLELKSLNHETDEIDPETLDELAEHIEEHIEEIDTALNSDTTTISRRDKLNTLSKLSTIVKAQGKLADANIKFSSVNADLEEAEELTDDILEAKIDEFTKNESTESINQYISDEINEIEVDIQATTTSTEKREQYKKNLLDLEEAIIENDLFEAIVTVLDAEQEADVEVYLGE